MVRRARQVPAAEPVVGQFGGVQHPVADEVRLLERYRRHGLLAGTVPTGDDDLVLPLVHAREGGSRA
ncbi:hypothetical protein [Kitasatospora sp. NPDC054795]